MSFAYSPFSLSGTGGGSSGSGRITVGASGASYPTVTAALAAGHTVMSVINNVSEHSLINVPVDGLQLTIDANANFDIGSGYFNVFGYNMSVDGNGRLTYAATNTSHILFDGVDGGRLSVSDITVDNNSSVMSCLTDIKYARFYDVIFDGNVQICGDSNIYEGCIYKNSTIIVTSDVDNTIIDGSIFEGVVLADSGNNTVISDSVVY
jgi:hypothetical protein